MYNIRKPNEIGTAVQQSKTSDNKMHSFSKVDKAILKIRWKKIYYLGNKICLKVNFHVTFLGLSYSMQHRCLVQVRESGVQCYSLQ